jgi:hypothetical protein
MLILSSPNPTTPWQISKTTIQQDTSSTWRWTTTITSVDVGLSLNVVFVNPQLLLDTLLTLSLVLVLFMMQVLFFNLSYIMFFVFSSISWISINDMSQRCFIYLSLMQKFLFWGFLKSWNFSVETFFYVLISCVFGKNVFLDFNYDVGC